MSYDNGKMQKIKLNNDEMIEFEIYDGKIEFTCQYDELNASTVIINREKAIELIEKLAKVAEHLPK